MLVPTGKNQHPISLRKLFPSASFVGCADIHVNHVSEHSRNCQNGSLFAAISGTKTEGGKFIQEAATNGATSVLCDRPQPDIIMPQCIVPHVRAGYAKLCHALEGMPGQKLKTVGITGTNGKTTTSYLVRSILNAAGHQAGLLGTIEYHDGCTGECSNLTTPDPPDLAKWLRRMLDNKTTHAVFEMSSHAMHQGRTAGIELDVAILTNITHDHLDYHIHFEDYKESKSQILKHCKPNASAIINQNDAHLRYMQIPTENHLNVTTYAGQDSDFRATAIQQSLTETQFLLHVHHQTIPIRTKLIGQHNVENCLAAAAACYRLGIDPTYIALGIEQLQGVPGRMEVIEMGQDYQIFVDYAHTDDALRRCVNTLRPVTENRLICLFGAGGDRDRSKRPLLAAAAEDADIVIVTSDNPRSEEPVQIIDDILQGFSETSPKVYVEPDREQAIQLAIELAEPGDALLIAGKGHETYQQIGNTRHEFDDRKVIRTKLRQSTIRLSA